MHVDEAALPECILQSRPLAEAYRLELALFVAGKEAALRVSGSLLHHAPDEAALAVLADQVADEQRHWRWFCRRLDQVLVARAPDQGSSNEVLLLRLLQGSQAGAAAPLRRAEVTAAVVIPPLRHYLDRCLQRADCGAFAEALLLLNVLLEGMSAPLTEYECRYWGPIDPGLAHAIAATAADEARHVEQSLELLGPSLAAGTLAPLAAEGLAVLQEVFTYYVRKLVQLFSVVLRQHKELFGAIELMPGRCLVEMTPAQQEQTILSRCAAEREHILARMGGPRDGCQESLSHDGNLAVGPR
jgi:hypothetical protein